MDNILNKFIEKHQDLKPCKVDIERAITVFKSCYRKGGKVLIAGNGGSSSDSEHIVGELMKGFVRERKLPKEEMDALIRVERDRGEYLAKHLQGSLPAISLSSHTSLMTAIANDVGGDFIFAQQVQGYGREEDVLCAISTSGNSENVVLASIVAKAKGMKVVSLTGITGGRLAELSDICIRVPAEETYIIQEFHVMIYHLLCRILEESFFVT